MGLLESVKDYIKVKKEDITTIGSYTQDGLIKTHIAVDTPFGYKRVAEIVKPEKGENLAAVLYVHWYEPGEPATSNRFQFMAEAEEIAKSGAVCICVETLWSDLDFFYKRSQKDDIQNSIEETVNLRRFLDVLLMEESIDLNRVAAVGHDFGGMYTTLVGRLDNRINNMIIMAATSRFSDWYLYYPELEGEDANNFIKEFDEIDPVSNVKYLDIPVLFQFGNSDDHVPIERANELFNSAGKLKELKIYYAGHPLNSEASKDRIEWLKGKVFNE